MSPIVDIHCSSLSRLMNCHGVAFLKNLPKSPSNPAAEEGTAAGELLEHRLLGKQFGTHAKNGVEFHEDMRFHTGELANDILGLAQSPVLCETKVNWQTRSGIWIMGQYDVSFVANGKLYIDDLKYGWGIVEVEKNWQLIGYAIGEIIRRQQPFEKIVMRIHQPRPHHEKGTTRTWEISYHELLTLKEEIEVRMLEIAEGSDTLTTGPQCKYCPGSQNSACPAFNRSFYAGVDFILNNYQQDEIDDRTIAEQLDLMARITDVMKIKADSLKQLAVDRIKNGGLIPNYTTEQSFGDRVWKKEISPLVIQTLTGVEIVKETMLSPSQAEKLGVSKDLIKGFVDRHYKGLNLVRKDAGKIADQIFNNKGVL